MAHTRSESTTYVGRYLLRCESKFEKSNSFLSLSRKYDLPSCFKSKYLENVKFLIGHAKVR